MEEDWEIFEFRLVEYEWDHEKDKKNRRKHGVGFAEAAQIFDHEVLARQDFHESEERYFAIGIAETRALAVVFTERQGNIRLISARRATPSERRRYSSNLGG